MVDLILDEIHFTEIFFETKLLFLGNFFFRNKCAWSGRDKFIRNL